MIVNKLSRICKIPKTVNGKLVKSTYNNIDKFEHVLGKELVSRKKMDKLIKHICEEIVKEESKAQLKALQIGKKLKVKNYIKNNKINLEFEFVEYKKDEHKTKYYEFKLYDKFGMIKNLFKEIPEKFVIGLDEYNYKQFSKKIKLNNNFERIFEDRVINVQTIEELFLIVVEEIKEK